MEEFERFIEDVAPESHSCRSPLRQAQNYEQDYEDSGEGKGNGPFGDRIVSNGPLASYSDWCQPAPIQLPGWPIMASADKTYQSHVDMELTLPIGHGQPDATTPSQEISRETGHDTIPLNPRLVPTHTNTSESEPHYFFCRIDNCTRRYQRHGNLQSHQQKKHAKAGMEIPKQLHEAVVSVPHTNRIHACVVAGCSRAFTELRNLWVHQDKCHSLDAVFCKWRLCKERSTNFVTQEALTNHVAETHKGNRYVCEVCGQYGVDRKDLMNRHMDRNHPEVGWKKVRLGPKLKKAAAGSSEKVVGSRVKR